MYERILIPTDGSNVAEQAATHAVDIAARYDAELYVLFVVDTDAVAYGLGTEQVDRLQQGKFGEMHELRERAERATGAVADRATAAGVTVHEAIDAGTPYRVIADFADDEEIDLIVMGSSGRSGVRRMVLGSVTERTIRATPVPVLVVDRRGADPDAAVEEADDE